MPTRFRKDKYRTLDWRGTPFHPYKPSFFDYRLEAFNNNEAGYMQIPMTMIPIKTNYDAHYLLRYVDLSFHNSLVRPGIQELIKKQNFLITMTHPSGVVSFQPQTKHGLISFDLENFSENLRLIVDTAKMYYDDLVLCTISDFGKMYGAN